MGNCLDYEILSRRPAHNKPEHMNAPVGLARPSVEDLPLLCTKTPQRCQSTYLFVAKKVGISDASISWMHSLHHRTRVSGPLFFFKEETPGTLAGCSWSPICQCKQDASPAQ